MAGQNTVEHKLRLLIETQLEESQKQKVGKQLKSILEGAAIGFDEAETKKNLVPIVRMIQRLFDKAEMKFDADKLLGMPSQQALQKIADMTADDFQTAFDRALAKSGGIKIDFGNMDLSGMTEPLERVTEELVEINRKIANETKKSVDDIASTMKGLDRTVKRTKKVTEDGVEKKVQYEVNVLQQTIDKIESTLNKVNNPKALGGEKGAISALKTAASAYEESVKKGDPWETQYQHMITFVSKYEAMAEKIKPLVDTSNPEFKALYDVLSPKAGAAKISLQHFVDIARGNELSEYKGQPWARENTLKEVRDILKGGISVKDGGDKNKNDDVPQEFPKRDNHAPNVEVEDKKPNTKKPISKPVDSSDIEKEKEKEKIRQSIEKEKEKEQIANNKRTTELLNRMKKINDEEDVGYNSIIKKKQGLEDILKILKKEHLLTDEVQSKYNAMQRSLDDRLIQFKSGLSDVERLIVETVETAKSKSLRSWDNVGFDDQKRYIRESLLLKPSISEDDRENLEYEATNFSRGAVELPEISEDFEPWITSLQEEYDKASDEIKKLIKKAVSLDNPDSSEVYDVIDEISFMDESLGELLENVIHKYRDQWNKFRESLLNPPTDVVSREEVEINAPQQSVQDDVIEHQENTAAIIAETQATEQLNAEKIESQQIDAVEDTHKTPAPPKPAVVPDEIPIDTSEEQVELGNLKGSIDDVTTAVNTKTEAFKTEGIEVGKVVDGEIAKLGELESKVNGVKANLEGLLANIKTGSNDIGAGLSNITVNVNHQNAEDVKIDAAALADAISKIQVAPDNEGLIAEIKALVPSLGNLVTQEDTLQAIKAILETKDTPVAGKVPPEIKAETSSKRENRFERLNDIASLYEDVEDVDAAIKEFGELYKEIVLIGESATKTIKPNKTGINTLKKIANGDIDLGYDYSWVEFKRNSPSIPTGKDTNASTVSIDENALRQLLDSIVYNVKIVHDDNDRESNKIAIDESGLKNVLQNLVYNVKITHDDADKQANKITLDEGALESTLKRVFANILNPPTEQNDSEPKNEPWALEKTLLSVKEVLGQIQTNTAKPESVEVAPAKTEIGNVLATENTLAAIKTAVEGINSKVVKGMKTTTSSGKQETKQEANELTPYIVDDDSSSTSDKSNDKSMKLLADISLQRKNLEKFITQLQTAGKLTDEYQVWIDNLTTFLNNITSTDDMAIWKKAFARTKTSVGIDDVVSKAEDKETGTVYKELIELQKTRNSLELKHAKAQDGSVAKQFYAEQLAQMDQAIARQRVIIDNEEYELKLAKMREDQARKLGEAEAKAADKDAAKAKKMAQKQAMVGKAGNAIGRAEGVWMNAISLGDDEHVLPKSFEMQVNSLYDEFEKLRLKQEEVRNTAAPVTNEQKEAFDKLKKELIAQTTFVNNLTNEIGELATEYQRLSGDNATVIGTNTLDSDAGFGAYKQQLKQAVAAATNGKAQIKNFDAATKTLTYTVKTGRHEFTEYTAAVRRADGALVSVQGTTKRTETFIEATTRKMKELTSYFSGMAIFNRIGQELRRGIQYVREIDLALTELKKVTDETEKEYDQFLQTAAKTGARLGTTISAVTEATATFAKLGYSMEQATEMAESAIVYKNVGDNIASTGDAADSIISTMKGFRLEASESMAIVDRFNEVGNKFAITSQGIGEALRLSASALSEGGNSLDESIGLITAANEVVNDPSSVGTALKTLTLRLRGSKTELEEMGEDVTDMATTTSQLQAKLLALTGGQVDIMLDENTFKNSTQILREMAEAWEDMNDIQRASALELMGGKRQANVLSALIQNFDTVENVIETSANSAGSALKENERYLDSIQGKIDQFNNALQSMWSGTLDSDLVKWFVNLGTELIKIVDTLGLIPSILAAILTYKLAVGAVKMFDLTSLGTYIGMLFTANSVTEVQGLLINKTALAQKLLNSTLIQAQAARMGLTAADLAGYSVTQLLTLGVNGLAAGFKNLWIAMGPVGWAIIGITVALTAGIAIFNAVHKTTAELKEELDDMKSSLSDVRSELDSVNSELKTTQERMAELLAMDSLTFEEQEELDRLRATNDELERRKELLESEEKRKSEAVGRQAARTADSVANKKDWWETQWFMGVGASSYALGGAFRNEGEEAQKNISDYAKIQEKLNNATSLKQQEKYQKKLDKEAEKIDAYILELSEVLEGVEYGDSAESDAALDYLAELQDKYVITRGDANAKTNAIKRIFNKDEYEVASNALDGLVEKLKKDPDNETVLNQISEQCVIAEEDLNAVGLSVEDAIGYFTKLGQEANFSTIEGKVAEMQLATSKMQSLLSNLASEDFTGLFDIETGEVSETAIAEYFQGTSEATRAEVARLIKDIKDEKISIDNALKQFEVFSIQSSLNIYIAEVQTNFKDVFVELEDADGLINTFEELGKAIGSTADALKVFNKAEAEMAYSGRVSIQTALELMEYTDDYGSILEVVDGKLKLVDNAEEVLIQTRINAIKTSAQASLEDATNAYEKAKLATATYKAALDTDMSAEVVAKSWEKVLAAGAGLWEGIKSLVSDESWAEAYNRGYNDTLSNITGYETVYDDSGLQALAEAEAEARSVMEAAEDRVNLANQLTPETLEAINDADDLDDVDDAKKKALDELMDKFQRAMDYWENRIKANQARYEQLQNEIDLLESRGKIVGKEYYAEQVKIEKERLDLLVKQRAEAKSYLNNFAEGSDEWWEVAHTLNDLEGEIDGVTSSVEDLSEAMRNVDVQIFEEIVDRFSQLSDELSNIRDILSSEDMFDEEGNWTKAGIAVLGTHLQDIEMYKKGLSEVEEELDYLLNGGGEDDYSGNEQAYYDRVKELTNQQHEYTKAIHDSEQSVVDMYESNVDAVEEYTDKLVESYQDYIDNVKEALDAERDLYEFKKNVKKQTKDIASLERRIASLSGSTNAGDIAERRRLEADLYGAREELDDTYYDHAKQTQQDALDAEAEAYEETMDRFVEGMRTSLAEATVNMESFLNSVTIAASMNADAVLEKYEETGLKLSPELTNPWVAAKNAIGEYGQGAIDLMNKWTQDGYWTDFTTKVGKELSSPWSTGFDAAVAFEENVSGVMGNIVKDIENSVKTGSEKLSALYQQIIDTKKEAQNIDTGSGNGGDSGYYESTVPDYHYNEGSQTESAAEKKENARKAAQAYVDKKGFSEGDKARWGQDLQFRPLLQALIKAGGSINDLKGKVYTAKTSGKIPGEYSVSGINTISLGADDITVSLGGKPYKAALSLPNNGNVVDYQINKDFGGKTPANGKLAMLDGVLYVSKNNRWYKVGSKNEGSALTSAARNRLNGYAKGTTGTKRDEWAITDEPQFGDELVLVPGKDGNLSFMRKGTGVVPADLTTNLMEWGKFDPSSMNLGGGVNVNMINNAVNKPEFNLSVDNFLRCDNVSQDSLPELKQFVKEQMNSLVKQMNYSLKKSGAR